MKKMKKQWKRIVSVILILMLILPDLFSGFNYVYAGTEIKSTAETTTVSKTLKDVTDGFSRVSLSMEMPTAGYQIGTPCNALFDMNITLDTAYLYEISEQFSTAIGFPEFQDSAHSNETMEDFNKRIDAFYDQNQEMQKLTWRFDIGKDFEHTSTQKVDIYEENGGVIGEAVFSEESSRLYVDVTFQNRIYNRHEARLGFSQNIQVKNSSLKSEPVFISWKDDGFIVATQSELDGDTTVDQVPDTITKTGPEKVNGTEIEYNIEVTGQDLSGYTVQDILPTVAAAHLTDLSSEEQQYLDVCEMKVNGTSVTPVITDGKCQYTFPSDGAVITDAMISIRVALTEAQRKALSQKVQASQNKQISFQVYNQAKLYANIDAEPTAVSDEVKTTMEYALLGKKGVQDSLNGNRFSWSLDINSSYNGYGLDQAYIIDTLDHGIHSYEAAAGVQVKSSSGMSKLSLNMLGHVVGDTDIYAELSTTGKVEAFLSKQGWSVSEGQACYFTYEYQNSQKQIMLIPYMNFVNQNVTLTYYTNINENYEASSGDIKNQVKLVWSYKDGEHPGPSPDFNFNISKNGTVNKQLGYKEGNGYNEAKQQLDWRVVVNYYPEELKNVSVEDVFDENKQKLLLDGSHKIICKVWDRDSRTVKETVELKSGIQLNKPYYTYNDSNKTLTILLGDVEKNEMVEILFSAQLIDYELLTKNIALTDKKYARNTVKISAGEYNSPLENIVEGQQIITNTFIRKAAIGTYQYDTKFFEWEVEINPNHLALSDIRVKDDPQYGMNFIELKAVKRVKKDGTEITMIANNNVAKFEDDQMEWRAIQDSDGKHYFESTIATPNDDTVVFTFTTKVTDDKIEESIQYNMGNGVPEQISLKNKAVLNAKYHYNNTSSTVEEFAEASNRLTVKAAYKEGAYQSEQAYIPWSVLVNIEQINMSGFSVKEELPELLELDTDSIKVYEAVINADGSLNKEATLKKNITETVKANLTADFRGFTYNITENYKDKALYFLFDTYFLDDVTKEDVKNKISLSKNDINFTTSPSDGGYDGTFDLEKSVGVSSKPVLLIKKRSANSVDQSKGLPLENAEFQLSIYEKQNTNEYRLSGTKKIVSKATGNGMFVNLKPGVLYKLEETKAPDGYARSTDASYYIFLGENESITGSITLTSESTIEASDIIVYRLKNNSYQDKEQQPPSFYYDNEVLDTNKITFTKVGADEMPLEGSTFVLEKKNGVVNADAWETTSNENGNVEFLKVDAGADADHKIEYLMTETNTASTIHDQGATFQVLTWMDNGGFQYEITSLNDKLATIKKPENLTEKYQIKNAYRSGTIQFKKTDSVTGLGVSGAEFDIYSNDTESLKLNTTSVKSDADGTVKFTNIPYYANGYTIKECVNPNGYVNSLVNQGVLTISAEDVSNAVAKKMDALASGQKSEFIIDKSNTRVENERIKGTISFTKLNSNNEAHAERTFALVLMDEDAETYFENAYPYTIVKDGKQNEKGTENYSKMNGITFMTAASGSNGLVEFKDVPYGLSYQIVELDALENADAYAPVTKKVTGTQIITAADNTNDYQVLLGNVGNTLLSTEFSILKKEAGSNETMSGVSFTLKGNDQDGKEYNQTYSTGEDGTCRFEDIPIGTYILSEMQVDGYEVPKTHVVEVKSEYNDTEKKNVAVAHIYEGVQNGSEWKKTETELEKTEKQVEILNTPAVTTFSFIKIDDVQQEIAGVTFHLYKQKMDGTYEEQAAYTSVSTKNGVVEFKDIPFANYKVREVRKPGYQQITDFEITRQDFLNEYQYINSGFTFNIQKVIEKNTSIFKPVMDNKMSMYIKNQRVISDEIEISKKNQDGNPISAQFKILQDIQENQMLKGTSFGKATVGSKCITDADTGLSEKFQLPYGKYIIKETECANVQEENGVSQLLQIYITIGEEYNEIQKQWNATVTITKVMVGDLELTGDQIAEYAVLSKTETSNYRVALVNHLKYGYLQVNKYLAEEDGTEQFKLENAKFKVEKFNDAPAGYEDYIILTTNEDGNFVINEDGSYTGVDANGNHITKHLYYGTYQVTELSTNRNYVTADKSAVVVFGDGQGETSDRHYAVISGNASDESLLEVTNNAAVNDGFKKLYNEPMRGRFILKKQAADGTNLNHAGFAVYKKDNNEAVATLVNTGDGQYRISALKMESTTDSYNQVDASNIPLVHNDSLLTGEYYIKEYQTEPGYIMVDEAVDFTIADNGTISFVDVSGFAEFDNNTNVLTVTNNPAMIQINKIDYENSNQAISDTVFTIYERLANGSYALTGTEYTTDEQGEIIINALPAGSYRVMETKAKHGYAKSDAQVDFTIDCYGVVTEIKTSDANFATMSGNVITYKNSKNGIFISKTYYDEDEKLTEAAAEAVFGLYQGDILVQQIETLEHAAAFSMTKDGIYELREISTGDDDRYILDTDSLCEITIQNGRIAAVNRDANRLTIDMANTNDTSLFLQIKNYQKADFSFIKKRSESEAGLDGVTFTLKSENTEVSAVSANDGEVNFQGIMPGQYKLREYAAADGYAMTENVVDVTVDEKGKVYYYHNDKVLLDISSVLMNQQTKVTIQKVDGDGNYVDGVGLTITGERFADGSDKIELITETEEIELVGRLITGISYTITETTRKHGYTVAEPVQFTINAYGEIENLENNCIRMCDEYILGSIRLIKHIPENIADYEGITFDLYYSEDSRIDVNDEKIKSAIALDQDGTIVVSGLKEGFYYFVETATKDELYLDTTPSELVYIGEAEHQSVVDLQIENTAFDYHVTLTKLSGYDSAPLANAEFTLYDEQNQMIAVYLSDADGNIHIPINKKGTYTLTETKAPYGYNLAFDKETAYSVTFSVDNTNMYQGNTLDLGSVINERKAGIVSVINLSTDGRILANGRFRILGKFADATVSEYELTFENTAKIFGSELLIGESYEIMEIAPPRGYCKRLNSIKFTVSEGKNELIIENAPISVDFGFIHMETSVFEQGSLTIKGEFVSADQKEIHIQMGDLNGSSILDGELLAGNDYLVEVNGITKQGMKFSDILRFTVTESGNILLNESSMFYVGANNQIIINQDSLARLEQAAEEDVPTGDHTIRIFRYLLILLIAALGLFDFRKKRC